MRPNHKKPTENFSYKEADERVSDYFYNHGFKDITPDIRMKLVRFALLLQEEQKKHNITRLIKLRDIAIKHFIDCLMVPKLVDLDFPLMDVGSGPGFPGIPLKILYPEKRIILCESVTKRVLFLKSVRKELELENLDILGKKLSSDQPFPVKNIITRAFAPLKESFDLLAPSLPVGGKLILMRGPSTQDELKNLKNTQGLHSSFRLKDNISYKIPNTKNDRCLLVFEKT